MEDDSSLRHRVVPGTHENEPTASTSNDNRSGSEDDEEAPVSEDRLVLI